MTDVGFEPNIWRLRISYPHHLDESAILSVHNDNIIHLAAKHISYDDHIIYGRHAVTTHPFKNSLWCTKSAYCLDIFYFYITSLHHILMLAPVATIFTVTIFLTSFLFLIKYPR